MAKLVTKFKYLKPNRKVSTGGYAKYIATREGVEKIDDTQKFAPATAKQKNLIEKILKDFPDSKDMFEYADYIESRMQALLLILFQELWKTTLMKSREEKHMPITSLPDLVPRDSGHTDCLPTTVCRFS